MLIYLINIFLLLTGAYVLRNSKKMYCIIASTQWILLSGLRHWSIGADTYTYYSAFELLKQTPWKTICTNVLIYIKNPFMEHDFKDPGYKLFEKSFQIFSGDYQVFLIFIAIVFTGLMGYWIYKNSEMPCLSFIIYSVLFYAFYAITGHRQTLATALIVFWGYKYIKERKLIKFLIISFVAFLLHKSSIVFVPFYFLANMKVTKLGSLISFIIIFIFTRLGKAVYAPLAEILGYGGEMLEYDGGGAGTYATILLLVCLVAVYCYPSIEQRRTDSKFLYNAMLLTIFTALFVYQHQGFMRVQQYYALFIMVTIPEIVKSVKKEQQTFVAILGGAILILYLIRNNPRYLFFFQ